MITKKQAYKEMKRLANLESSLVLSAYKLGYQIGLYDTVKEANNKLTDKQKKAIRKVIKGEPSK